MTKEARDKIAGGLQEAAIIAPYLARIAALEAALRPFADCEVSPAYGDDETFKCLLMVGDLRAARAALEKKND